MIQAICWTLIHSLWQGLIFTVITGLVMLATKKAPAATRYNSLCLLLFLFLVVCGCTFLFERYNKDGHAFALAYTAPFSGKPVAGVIAALNEYLTDHAHFIVLIWCLLFIAKCMKLTAGLVYSRRIRSYKTFSPPAYWPDKLDSLRASLQIRKKVALMESALTHIPIVIGHLRPVIFIPLGLLTSLPEGEIEAVLLHELAHIRRHDYLVNFLQNIVANIFFFNPGLLWISSLIRDERENCCDDIAISRTKDKFQFVRALVSFKEHALDSSPPYPNVGHIVPAFAGTRNKLLQRAIRIIHNKNPTLNPAERIFFLISCFLAASLLFAASTLRPLAATNQPAAIIDKRQVLNDHEQAARDTTQMEIDMKQAQDDAKQAHDDARQAQLDAKQTDNADIQLDKDRVQAEINKRQAEINARQAEKEMAEADFEKQKADRDRKRADRDRKRADFDKQQLPPKEQ
jgi:bla regulator protein BlaR1